MRLFIATVVVFIVMLVAGVGPYRYEFLGDMPAYARGDTWTGRLDTCVVHFQNAPAECTGWWKD